MGGLCRSAATGPEAASPSDLAAQPSEVWALVNTLRLQVLLGCIRIATRACQGQWLAVTPPLRIGA